MAMTTTGDISYRTAAYIAREFLTRAQPLLILDKFGQSKPLPKNSTKTMKFRGYEHLPNQPKPLTEGVTPASSTPTYRDIEATIGQYGDWVELTDVLTDTLEDPLIPEFSDILGEQAGIMRERITSGVLLSGTNVHFSGAAAVSRATVSEPVTLGLQRRVMRGLKRQLASQITSFVNASPNYGTTPIGPCYVAVCHTDLEANIRDMPGFKAVETYGSYTPLPGEVGSVEGVRYLTSTVMDPWADAGANIGTTSSHGPAWGMVSTTGSKADVYPILYLGKNAYGIIPFARSTGRGDLPISPKVLNPNVPRGGDPLGQRGSIGWKMYHTAIILYDFWMARAEVTATSL